MLRGIDVSSNQPASICSIVPHDFAIVKMSGNPQSHAWDYVNPYAKRQADDAYRKHGRVGLYHFTWGKDATEEATFFFEQVKKLGYIGKAMLVVDYEGEALSLGREWVRAFAATVEKLACYKPVIYASGSVIVSQRLAALGYPLWCANYSKGYDAIRGYSIDGCRIYPGCESSILWQFTSQGYLDGYDGPLDLDVFYGEDWHQFTGRKGGAMATASKVLEIAQAEVGRKEGTKYGRWYEQNVDRNPNNYDYGGAGVPYCAMFVSWVFDQAGASCAGIPGAYCPSILAAAKKAGKVVAVKDAKPGDVVLFDWDGGVSDHVGIVKSNDGLRLRTIEGNTDNGWVLEKSRPYTTVAGVVRPDYQDPSPAKEVQMYASNGTQAQKFSVEWDGDGEWFALKNLACGLYLDVAAASAKKGAKVQLYPGNGTPAQRFKAVPVGDGYKPKEGCPVYLVPKCAPNLVLDMASGKDADGTAVQTWEKNGTPAQQWALLDLGGRVWTMLCMKGSHRAIDAKNGGR